MKNNFSCFLVLRHVTQVGLFNAEINYILFSAENSYIYVTNLDREKNFIVIRFQVFQSNTNNF